MTKWIWQVCSPPQGFFILVLASLRPFVHKEISQWRVNLLIADIYNQSSEIRQREGLSHSLSERVVDWLRHLTCKPKVRTAVGSNPTLDSLVAVRKSSPGRPEPCEGNLVAVAGSCGGLMVKYPWPLPEISLSDFRGLATLNKNTYLPYLPLI